MVNKNDYEKLMDIINGNYHYYTNRINDLLNNIVKDKELFYCLFYALNKVRYLNKKLLLSNDQKEKMINNCLNNSDKSMYSLLQEIKLENRYELNFLINLISENDHESSFLIWKNADKYKINHKIKTKLLKQSIKKEKYLRESIYILFVNNNRHCLHANEIDVIIEQISKNCDLDLAKIIIEKNPNLGSKFKRKIEHLLVANKLIEG